MDRWQNKVAVVTGASAGIGAAVVKDLIKCGLIVVGLARRQERVEQIRESLPENLRKNLHAMKCDVSDEQSVNTTFAWICKTFGGIDILINNAGIIRTTELVNPSNTKDILDTINTNVMGIVYCTRLAFQSMKSRNVAGHVVLVNSVAGHMVPALGDKFPSLNIYSPTKYAVTAMTEVYRHEFRNQKTKVKITSISPGAVDTEIFPTELEAGIKSSMPLLKSEDISNSILYVLGTPPHVQVHELTIRPILEEF